MTAALISLTSILSRWYLRAQGRRLLLEMDARQLKDIGVSRSTATAEAAKPWWRA